MKHLPPISNRVDAVELSCTGAHHLHCDANKHDGNKNIALLSVVVVSGIKAQCW